MWFHGDRERGVADLKGAQDLRYLRPLATNFPPVDALIKVYMKEEDGKERTHFVGFQFTVAREHPLQDGKHQLANLMRS